MAAENKERSFGDYLDQQMQGMRAGFETGEKIVGTVVMIGSDSVFVDINAKSEGVLNREEVEDKEGNLTVEEGQKIEAYFVSGRNGEFLLTTKFTGSGRDQDLWDAYQAGIPVEGRVESERKGGFEVRVGSHPAFCPYSQIDVFKKDAAAYLGEKFLFLVTEYEEHGGNLVLSRRRYLEGEREKQMATLKDELEVGAKINGQVTRIVDFGAFVDIGGTEGLIPIREISWGRNTKPEDILSPGQTVTVVVNEIDWDRERFSLSLREAEGNPWDTVEDKFVAGRTCSGVITKLMPFGAFVELTPGIEGLIHISKLGRGKRINHPQEVVSEGEPIEVTIENVDVENRRISLSIEDTTPVAPILDADGKPATVDEGTIIKGKVDGIQDFGLFIDLGGGRSGLLHVSQLDLPHSANRLRTLTRDYPEGSEISVVIQEVKGDRISLTTPEKVQEALDAANIGEMMTDSDGGDLGSLGDALAGLSL